MSISVSLFPFLVRSFPGFLFLFGVFPLELPLEPVLGPFVATELVTSFEVLELAEDRIGLDFEVFISSSTSRIMVRAKLSLNASIRV